MFPVEVAVPAPLPHTFTYRAEREIPPGARVLVPFGGRQLVGVALGPAKDVGQQIELKDVRAVVDETPVYSKTLLDLARWMSGYYMHPLGEVLRTMLPASSTKVVRETYSLGAKGQKLRDDPGSADGQLLAALFGKRDSLTAATIKTRLKKRDGAPSFRALVAKGWLTKARGTSMRARRSEGTHEDAPVDAALESGPGESAPGESASDAPPVLTERQQDVFATVVRDGLGAPESKVFLLHGITGSGKTEVYLHLIAELLAEGAAPQALVLVPEISLTPQMTRVFERRFPGLVAVVHSAMTDPERWAQMERIRRGEARILIGPRSAVFGPFQSLRLIIVDEEHDGSYKQSTGLTYNGRDVAIVRGKLEHATVVLGSATPSMESYNNALTGRYALLTMPERVNARPLPAVELIELTSRRRFGEVVHGSGVSSAAAMPSSAAVSGSAAISSTAAPPVAGPDAGVADPDDDPDDLPIAPAVVAELRENLAKGHQAIVLVNRRGYAYYLFSLEEKKAVECPHCSISMTLHARSTLLRCHYCDYRIAVAKVVAGREGETFVSVGYGSQRAEELLRRKVPGARVVRLDSDVVVDRELLPKTLSSFREREIDILVGTQILAKGHDFPNVTLIAILEVDQALMLPDFRAGERTFQLIVQAAGRAGRAGHAGRVLIQTQRAGHPVIGAAVAQDYAAFVARELEFRRRHHYPPFARMIAFELNGPDDGALTRLCDRIDGWVDQLAKLRPELIERVRVLGPAVPPIERVRGRWRRSFVLASEHVDTMRQVASMFATAFDKLPGDIRLRIDVDPQSLV